MPSAIEPEIDMFADRRKSYPDYSPGGDRRQFGANYDDLTPAGRDLGMAIDRYKVERHRRFINADELLSVVVSLGYRRITATPSQDVSGVFVDRRARSEDSPVGSERRQFTGGYNELTPEGRELALAIDQYKLFHRRRMVSPDELVNIVATLGYSIA